MKLTDRVYETCPTCNRQELVAHETYGCEVCQRVLSGDGPYLEVTVFYNGDRDTDRLIYCSWEHVLAHLPSIQTDHFISLPYLSYDEVTPGIRARDFFVALNRASMQTGQE